MVNKKGFGHLLAVVRWVVLFPNETFSDDSTCIYVDSSFSSTRSEFDVRWSELNSSFSNSSVSYDDEIISEPGVFSNSSVNSDDEII